MNEKVEFGVIHSQLNKETADVLNKFTDSGVDEKIIICAAIATLLRQVYGLCGLDKAIFMAVDDPEFLHAILDTVAEWNLRRMEVMLDEGLDFFIRRAWYETTDFWSPAVYREFILPVLTKEAELAHHHGAKFCYVNTSSNIPLLDMFFKGEVDKRV